MDFAWKDDDISSEAPAMMTFDQFSSSSRETPTEEYEAPNREPATKQETTDCTDTVVELESGDIEVLWEAPKKKELCHHGSTPSADRLLRTSPPPASVLLETSTEWQPPAPSGRLKATFRDLLFRMGWRRQS
jgi:hypothetical protein